MQIPFALAPAASRPFDVVGLGQNSVDQLAVIAEFPRSNTKHKIERFARLPGGQVASAMVCCARLGWRARYVGRFGDDDLGRFGLASLEQEGVDISAAQLIDPVEGRGRDTQVEGARGKTDGLEGGIADPDRGSLVF